MLRHSSDPNREVGLFLRIHGEEITTADGDAREQTVAIFRRPRLQHGVRIGRNNGLLARQTRDLPAPIFVWLLHSQS
jgi:hypothetical protein